MDTLEIRFSEKKVDVLYEYDSVSVTITNSKGTNKDIETYNLTKNDSCFYSLFTVAIDSTPTQNDSNLQVCEEDTIIALFQNPMLPLDMIRLAVPYKATSAIQSNPVISNGAFSYSLIKNGRSDYRLKYNNLPADGKVKLYTINGRKVFERQIIKGNSSIKLPTVVSHSIYLLQVHYGEKVCKKKVLLR